LFGLGGLSILVILGLTSNQFSVRTLGGRNWKRLHRLAYIAAALLIYHQAIAGKGHWHIARWLLFALVALQLARLGKVLLLNRDRVSAVANGARRGRSSCDAALSRVSQVGFTGARPSMKA
jgi:sulfoxide reductase heme-binding subunit YedZ